MVLIVDNVFVFYFLKLMFLNVEIIFYFFCIVGNIYLIFVFIIRMLNNCFIVSLESGIYRYILLKGVLLYNNILKYCIWLIGVILLEVIEN